MLIFNGPCSANNRTNEIKHALYMLRLLPPSVACFLLLASVFLRYHMLYNIQSVDNTTTKRP